MSSALIDTTADNYDFYPTPDDLIDKMIEYADLKDKEVILEPSAGAGDIVKRLYYQSKHMVWQDEDVRLVKANYGRYHYEIDIEVDCIEADPRLQHILRGNNYRLIHDDFLTFRSFKRYDTIIMNPPFSNGDEHLLHALELQKNGGKVICLLNAETIRNPYTNKRKLLLRLLDEYGAEVEYLYGAFAHGERKTNVETALVYVNIPKPKRDESFIFGNLKKAKEEEEREYAGPKEVVSGDYITQAIEMFNFEVEGTLNLLKEYEAMKPHISSDFKEHGKEDASPLVLLSLCTGKSFTVNNYMKAVRRKYWMALFNNEEFMANLTTNLRDQYWGMLEKLVDYDFSLFNIKQIQAKMKSEMMRGLEDTIMKLFDKLSAEHSWYPETNNNIHYFNGWATNKAHKINRKKVILPLNGYSAYWGDLDVWHIEDTLRDIEKALNYLSDGNAPDINMHEMLTIAKETGQAKKINLKYFKITVYKKGTCHIEFKYPELIDKLNIYGAQHRNWLPPCYGKKPYEDLNRGEKEAIDEFQGEAAYREICEKSDFYLNVGSEILLLGN